MSTMPADVSVVRMGPSAGGLWRITRRHAARFLAVVIRLGLGAVFLWSSLPKLRQPYDFLSSVYNYQLVGPQTGVFVAAILPWLELLVGLCLIAGLFVGGCLLTSALMLAAFLGAQIWALGRGLSISCGCFQATDPGLVSYLSVFRTGLLLGAAALGFVLLVTAKAIPAKQGK